MDSTRYELGHRIPEKTVIETLEHIHCKDISNFDYNKEKAQLNKDGTIRPDFICKLDFKNCAVEIGTLNNSPRCKDRVDKLLNHFDCVIHIYTDKEKNYLNCIKYERLVVFGENSLNSSSESKIKNQEYEKLIKRIINLINEDTFSVDKKKLIEILNTNKYLTRGC